MTTAAGHTGSRRARLGVPAREINAVSSWTINDPLIGWVQAHIGAACVGQLWLTLAPAVARLRGAVLVLVPMHLGWAPMWRSRGVTDVP